MIIAAIRTHKITPRDKSILKILDQYSLTFKENSVLAISSKIIAISENRVVKKNLATKEDLVPQESELYLPKNVSKYGVNFTIKNNLLVASAGIDESNAGEYLALWPKDPQKSANEIREYLSGRFKLKKVGVIVTDSRSMPLRWGAIGLGIAHSGFQALNNYVGKKDIFGRKFRVEKSNIVDGLAAVATLVMGEGDEQTPLAVIEDLPFVKFQSRNPTKKELEFLKIKLEDDLFAPFLKAVEWKKGGA